MSDSGSNGTGEPEHLPQPELVDPDGQPIGGRIPNDRGANIALGAGIVVLLFPLLGPLLGVIAGPLAIVTGYRAMKRIDRSEGTLGGRTRAKAGFILGIVGTILLAALLTYLIMTFNWPKESPDEGRPPRATTEVTGTTEPG